MPGGSTFALEVSRWIIDTRAKGTLVMKKLGFDGLKGVLYKSPVDTGRFRASWRLSINSTNTTVEPERNASFSISNMQSSLSGTRGKARQAIQGQYDSLQTRHASEAKTVEAVGAAALNNMRWEDSIWITNNVAYAPKLEAGGSQQAPDGVLRITVLEIRNGFNSFIASLGK